jgi:hypothetical protein
VIVGRQHRVVCHLELLYGSAKYEASGALATYVNYRTPEHLCLPFLHFVGFNVSSATRRA